MNQNNTIKFFVEGDPVAWHRSGYNRRTGTIFKNKIDVVWQNHIRNQAIMHRPNVLPEGPVALTIQFWMPRPKYHKPGIQYFHTKKPDAENLLKSVQDAMTGSMYKDDAQIVQVTVSKIYAPAGQKTGVGIILTYL